MAVLGRDDNEIGRRLRGQIEAAISGDDERKKQRLKAWNQFWLKPVGNESADISAAQSPDVNSMVTAVQAQVNVALDNESLVQFDAMSADDEEQAQAESRACNKVFGDSGGYLVLSDVCWSALMYGTGVGKVYWQEDIDTYRVTHNNIIEADIPILIEQEQGVKRRLLDYDADKKVARVEITETKKRLRVKVVDASRWFMTPEWDELDLQPIPLCGEVHYKSRNELSRMGVPWSIVKELQAVTPGQGLEADDTSQRKGNVSGAVEPLVFQMDICRVYEAYAWLSFDKDADRAYLYKCWLADAQTSTGENYLLPPEQVMRVPYAAGSPFPIPNEFWGQALAEKIGPTQDIKTRMKRLWNDNVTNCSFGRFGIVVGQADAGDVMTPKAGGAVRIKSPTAIVPIPVIDVGPSIAAALEYEDKQRTEQGGAAVDMIGAEMEVAGDTAHGTERRMAAKELMVTLITRNLAETAIHNLFLLVHAELRDGDNGPIAMKVADAWVEVDPASWPKRTQCQVKVGYSMGERSSMAATLQMALTMYGQAMSAGLQDEFVSAEGLYKMTVDWLTLNMIDSPEAYFINPASEQAVQARQAKQQMMQAQQLEAARQQAEILALPERIKAETDQFESNQKTWVEVFKAILDASTAAHAQEVQGAVDVSRAGIEAKALTSANAGGGAGAGNGAASRGAGGGGGGNGSAGGSNGSGRKAA